MGRRARLICNRGHEVSGANWKLKNRGTGCRACECALSQAHNMWRRKGQAWAEADLKLYADMKYEEFRGRGL